MKFQPMKIWWLLAMGVSLIACEPSGHKWGEEVLLSDDRIIVIERETLVERGGDEWAHNRAGVKPREYRIRFAAPDGSGRTIEWKSIKRSEMRWPEQPLILDVEGGQPIVFTTVSFAPGCEVYVKYRYQDGAWVELLLTERFEERQSNLLIRDGVEMPKFVNLQDKRRENESIDYRRALKYVGPRRKVCG
jgi:hypothetical protein